MGPHDSREGASLVPGPGEPNSAHGAPDLLLCPLPSEPVFDHSPSSAESAIPVLPRIQGNKRQLREVTHDALQALIAANDPPTVFQRGNLLTRLRVRPETGAPYLEPLTAHGLRGHLARAADWLVARSIQEELVLEDGAPPMEVVHDLFSMPDWAGVPLLRAVVECPTYTPEGTLVAIPGYHPGSGLWYFPGPDLHLPCDRRHWPPGGSNSRSDERGGNAKAPGRAALRRATDHFVGQPQSHVEIRCPGQCAHRDRMEGPNPGPHQDAVAAQFCPLAVYRQ